MLLKDAALRVGVVLSVGTCAFATADAADLGLDARPMVEQQVTTSERNVFSVWSESAYIRTDDRRPLSLSRSHIWQTTAGFDYAFGRTFTIGAGISAAQGRTRELAIPGRSESDALTGFARATVYFLRNFNAGVIGGYGVTETDGFRFFPAGVDAYSRQSNTAFVGAHVGAFFENEGFFANPNVRILVAHTEHEAFGTSLGSYVPAGDDDFTRASLGSEIGYRFNLGGLTIAPSVRAYATYDLDLPSGYRDRTALDVSGALTVYTGNLSFGVEGLTTLGRDETRTHSLRGFASYRF